MILIWLYGYLITFHLIKLPLSSNAYHKGGKAFLVLETVAFFPSIHASVTYSCLTKFHSNDVYISFPSLLHVLVNLNYTHTKLQKLDCISANVNLSILEKVKGHCSFGLFPCIQNDILIWVVYIFFMATISK